MSTKDSSSPLTALEWLLLLVAEDRAESAPTQPEERK
jgi:hypothetical protein